MKTLIVIVIALAMGTLLAVMSVDDPGVVVLARAPHRIEMPLALFAVILAASFAILYLLFNFLFNFFATPKKVKQWNARRRNQKAQDDTLRGYAQLIEGDWSKGEKHLTKRIGDSKTPMLNYLGAAYAAQQRKDFVRRDEYLGLAEGIDPANRMAVDLTRARLYSQAGQLDEAKSLLETMHSLAPANATVLRLLGDVYRQRGETDLLAGILPKLEKTKALPPEQCDELDLLCRAEKAQQAESATAALTHDGAQQPQISAGAQALKEWKAVPGAKKKKPAMAAMYGKRLIEAGELTEAEKLLRGALKRGFESELATLYGQSRASNLRKQLKFASNWLISYEDEPAVHLTLGRLHMALEDAEKAEQHYLRAIELGAPDEAFYELGQYYEDNGDRRAALVLYKKGVQTAIALGGGAVGESLAASQSLDDTDSAITLGATETLLMADQSEGANEELAAAVEDIKEVAADVADAKDNVIDLPLVEEKKA